MHCVTTCLALSAGCIFCFCPYISLHTSRPVLFLVLSRYISLLHDLVLLLLFILDVLYLCTRPSTASRRKLDTSHPLVLRAKGGRPVAAGVCNTREMDGLTSTRINIRFNQCLRTVQMLIKHSLLSRFSL